MSNGIQMNPCCRADVQFYLVPFIIEDGRDSIGPFGKRDINGKRSGMCLVDERGRHVCCYGNYAFDKSQIGWYYCLHCEKLAIEKHPPLPATPEMLATVASYLKGIEITRSMNSLRAVESEMNRRTMKAAVGVKGAPETALALLPPPTKKARTRAPISPATRFEVFKRDRFSCVYCGRCPKKDNVELELVIDHQKSFSSGGADDASNFVTACNQCNSGKGAKSVTPEELNP